MNFAEIGVLSAIFVFTKDQSCNPQTIGSTFQSNINQNLYIFIQENAFENVVWKMAVILSRPQCVNDDIKNNAWVTVNNDFWVTSEAICQWFSRVTKSRVKIISKSYHEWHKNRYSR